MRRSRISSQLTAGLLLAFVCAGCNPVDVVVAEIPPGPGGGNGRRPPPCASSADCSPNDYCEKSTCDQAIGECRPRPITCPSNRAPVCGCNGVTYWNECLRRRSGIASSTESECESTASGCGGPDNEICPDTLASCARLLPPGASCNAPSFAGRCWVVPDECPAPSADVVGWHACGLNTCADTCAAIRSQSLSIRGPTCQ